MVNAKRDEVRIRLLKHLPKNAIGAEIGVWKGYFSEHILEYAEPKELHLIDPWIFQPEFNNTAFGRAKHKDEIVDFYAEIVERYKDDDRVHIHRMTSEEAFAKFPDGYLDWVYLDGNHNAPFIGEDLRASLQKVKADGVISGDDYHWRSTTDGVQPVKAAVQEILEELGDQAKFKTIGSQFLIRLNR